MRMGLQEQMNIAVTVLTTILAVLNAIILGLTSGSGESSDHPSVARA